MSSKRPKYDADPQHHSATQADGASGFIRSYYNPGKTAHTESMREQRQQLPAYKHRLQLLYAIETHLTTIIVGEPGSGKSTQLPQYLYEAGWAADGKTIACTQPRRIAAAMLAQRVSAEMGVELGTTVGYSVRFSNASDSQLTRIKFLTDGTLIRECMADPLLSAYSVVIVDEAQDRSIATDTLLALLKKIQRKRKNDLRVVISSASLDAERFRSFFRQTDSVIVSISGQQFPVDTHYLSDPCENYLNSTIEAVASIHKHEPSGDILAFLPGKDDINAAISGLDEQRHRDQHLELLVPVAMYAGLSSDDQKAVFDPPAAGRRKVVFSTNVAETSVTVDGIVYVVDCGFVKQRVFDPATRLDRLVTRPIS
ncbi:ATPdependent RNA helicase, partial [Coemansia erecta]